MLKNATGFASLCLVLYALPSYAEELSVMEADTVQGYGQYLSDKFAEVKGHQVKVEPNMAAASGLVLGNEGIIIVPTKIEDNEENPAVETESGGPLAYLFMSPRFNPLESDSKIDAKKLRTVQYEDDGEVKEATCLILAVRHVEGDDWRLYVYGAEKKPLLDAKFSDAEQAKDRNLTIHVRDVKDGKGTLVVTVLKKYEAAFAIGH